MVTCLLPTLLIRWRPVAADIRPPLPEDGFSIEAASYSVESVEAAVLSWICRNCVLSWIGGYLILRWRSVEAAPPSSSVTVCCVRFLPAIPPCRPWCSAVEGAIPPEVDH
ncbi:unnamed protein product [Victoria cruziana]